MNLTSELRKKAPKLLLRNRDFKQLLKQIDNAYNDSDAMELYYEALEIISNYN